MHAILYTQKQAYKGFILLSGILWRRRLTNIVLQVYENSVGYTYAISKGFPYEIIPVNKLQLPSGIMAIEASDFEGSACEIVIIPDGCKSIGSKAFANCKSLLRIVIPASVEIIAEDAFEGCNTYLVIEKAIE